MMIWRHGGNHQQSQKDVWAISRPCSNFVMSNCQCFWSSIMINEWSTFCTKASYIHIHTAKMCSKIMNTCVILVQWQSSPDFILKMHQKRLAAWLRPHPLRVRIWEGKGKRQEGKEGGGGEEKGNIGPTVISKSRHLCTTVKEMLQLCSICWCCYRKKIKVTRIFGPRCILPDLQNKI